MAMAQRQASNEARRGRETVDMERFVRRVLRSITRRAVEGDMEAVEALSRLEVGVRAELRLSVAALRAEPWSYSWTDVAEALGVSKQAAQQRFGR